MMCCFSGRYFCGGMGTVIEILCISYFLGTSLKGNANKVFHLRFFHERLLPNYLLGI
jgi:hypothetical protein